MSTIALPEPDVALPHGQGAPGESVARTASPPRNLLHRFVRGRTADPAWVRPSLLGLLVATAVLYLWGLGASGWANSFYSAAAQAGSKSWSAFFYGASDAAGSITVDKPPASLWLMALSVRIFGLSSWSILVPQAIEGVAAVGLLYATVRRWFSPAAALLAGAVMALTPIATLMFRFNNPDALLVLLLVAGAYATVRALEHGKTWWLVAAFSCVGFGFLTKMLQALLVVPAFALVYLLAGPPKLGRRIWQLVLGGVALLVSAGWWVAIVELVPTSARPYIGGSQSNSVLDLVFGYNGFGRLTGNETGSVGGGAQAGSRWGETGWTRMFNAEYGGQASWLLPAALLLLVVGLVLTIRAKRTDRTRAALVLWGGWLVVTAATFSLGRGIIHPYYTVALAPAIGALVGIGGALLWSRRSDLVCRIALAATLAVTAVWAYQLLGRTPDWYPALRSAVLIGGLVAAGALLLAPLVLKGRGAMAVVGVGLIAALAGPTAYSIATAATAHEGALPTAGPPGASRGAGPGGGRFGGPPASQGQSQGQPRGQFAPGGGTPPAGASTGGPQGATFPGQGALPGGTGGPGGMGGLLNGSTPSAELVAALDADADQYTWVAATIGANQAAGYQLATGDSVMPIGGFNGTDPSPTLAEFQALVAAGKIHYFLGGGGFGGGMGGAASSSEITSWVTSNFEATTVGGVTLYDLTT